MKGSIKGSIKGTMKGVILCAGRGTRMRPFSHTLPKTLLPVANRPLLEHCIRKMLAVGIREIAVVINPLQTSIADYVAGRQGPECRIELVLQREPLGIAHALKAAKGFLKRDPFVLLLGDNLIGEPLETLVEAFQGKDGALLLSRVENPSDYGIAEVAAGRIERLEEKPQVPKSDLAVVGAYAFRHTVFEAIAKLQPSARGEYEITDAVQALIESGKQVAYAVTERPNSDVGTVSRWLAANRWLLEEQLGGEVQVGAGVRLENCILRGPVRIGDGCLLRNAVIGPHVSLGTDCELVECEIADSICLDGVRIANVGPKVKGSILGRHVHVRGEAEESPELQVMLGDDAQLRVAPKKQEKRQR